MLDQRKISPRCKVSFFECAVYLQGICSSAVLHMHWDTMYFALKYPLKCSEVCFEVQQSAYFTVLGLHCTSVWASKPKEPHQRGPHCEGGQAARSPWTTFQQPVQKIDQSAVT